MSFTHLFTADTAENMTSLSRTASIHTCHGADVNKVYTKSFPWQQDTEDVRSSRELHVHDAFAPPGGLV